MKNSNTFIIGAPKCGTTTIHYWLKQHPNVFSPKKKEPHYYYNPYGEAPSRAEYDALYDEVQPEHGVALDSSVWYLFSEVAVPRILEEKPDAKFIVCLRNPVQMAPSLHNQKLISGHEKIPDFKDAWAIRQRRASGQLEKTSGLSSAADSRHMDYFGACLLGHQVQVLLDQAPRENVLICFLEDIAEDAAGTYGRICAFLGIEEHSVSLAKRNSAKRPKNVRLFAAMNMMRDLKRRLGIRRKTRLLGPITRRNISHVQYDPIDDALVMELKAAFKDDIDLLSRTVDRDLSAWLR